jgi:hypothetical protein
LLLFPELPTITPIPWYPFFQIHEELEFRRVFSHFPTVQDVAQVLRELDTSLDMGIGTDSLEGLVLGVFVTVAAIGLVLRMRKIGGRGDWSKLGSLWRSELFKGGLHVYSYARKQNFGSNEAGEPFSA